jgi:hypothetical protein
MCVPESLTLLLRTVAGNTGEVQPRPAWVEAVEVLVEDMLCRCINRDCSAA